MKPNGFLLLLGSEGSILLQKVMVFSTFGRLAVAAGKLTSGGFAHGVHLKIKVRITYIKLYLESNMQSELL